MHSFAPIAGITSAVVVELDAEAAPVEAGDRLAELLAAAVGRVGVRRRVGDRALHRLDDRPEGRHVGVADARA